VSSGFRETERSLRLRAGAKLNLALDIVGRRADGRHNIETVMQSVNLADDVEVTVRPGQGRISVQVGATRPGLVARVPEGEHNIAHKAASRFLAELQGGGGGRCGGCRIDVDVRIHKSIPTEAGLGGGSADAGAVLVALNRLAGEVMTRDRLRAVGERIGADVPFAIYALERETTGAAFARGVGEVIQPVPGLAGSWFVIAVPAFGLSTRDMYGLWDARFDGHIIGNGDRDAKRPCARTLADAMIRGERIEHLCGLMTNDFHSLAAEQRPEIGRVARALMENGALCSLLTGSGSAVFGVFGSEGEATAASQSNELQRALSESRGAFPEQDPVTIVAAAAAPPAAIGSTGVQPGTSGRRLG
jgi:4-diphosphocytidyl-2-C-methyl-D-erythritol kinase